MAGHEIGTGAYTISAMVAAEHLGSPVEAVTGDLGDPNLPPVPGAAAPTTPLPPRHGQGLREMIRDRIAIAATQAKDGPFTGQESQVPEARQRDSY